MTNSSDYQKKALLVHLILTFYCLGALVMLFLVTYPPFAEVKENFNRHASVFEQYITWVLYVPGGMMLLSAIHLIFFRPQFISRSAVCFSAFLSFVFATAMLWCMKPLHHQWINEGFDNQAFEQAKRVILVFQIVPLLLQAIVSIYFIHLYLRGKSAITQMLFIALFVLCFFPMGTIFIECHLNYALWQTVGENDWLSYRKLVTDMSIFAPVFLIPFYFPIILLIVMGMKRRNGFSRGHVFIALGLLVYVFIISAAYFVPDIQFELDKYHSQRLIDDLIKNEIWMRMPMEIAYWITIALMFWWAGTDRYSAPAKPAKV